MLCLMLILAALSACILQLAVLKDGSIVERGLVEVMRRLRIAAWLVVAVYLVARLFQGYEMPPMLMLPMLAMAGADTISAAVRLWPQMENDA